MAKQKITTESLRLECDMEMVVLSYSCGCANAFETRHRLTPQDYYYYHTRERNFETMEIEWVERRAYRSGAFRNGKFSDSEIAKIVSEARDLLGAKFPDSLYVIPDRREIAETLRCFA